MIDDIIKEVAGEVLGSVLDPEPPKKLLSKKKRSWRNALVRNLWYLGIVIIILVGIVIAGLIMN